MMMVNVAAVLMFGYEKVRCVETCRSLQHQSEMGPCRMACGSREARACITQHVGPTTPGPPLACPLTCARLPCACAQGELEGKNVSVLM